MWKQVLVRELAAVVILKLAVLTLIWYAFFAQPDKQQMTGQSVGQFLLGDSLDTTLPPIQSNSDTGVENGYRDGG